MGHCGYTSFSVSKAFTSEETADAPVLGRALPKSAGPKRPITAEGFAALSARVQELNAQRLQHKAEGQLDAYAKADHTWALAQLTLDSVEVVLTPHDTSTARFGHWVRYQLRGPAKWARLVGPDEAEPLRRLVSVQSPLGQALLGQPPGGVFELERPQGLDEGALLEVALAPVD